MKNQYFGDINDYRKYGLLLAIVTESRLRPLVVWMLTPSDASSDGRFTKYLEDREHWAGYDGELYDSLREWLASPGGRHVRSIEASEILPEATFMSALLNDPTADRAVYMREALSLAQACDLVFFDPDNGIEIESVQKGQGNSSKYVYWDEIETFYSQQHSLLIYQHFPRVKRDEFVRQLAERLSRTCPDAAVTSFQTAHVVFFLVEHPRHQQALDGVAGDVQTRWKQEFRIGRHTA